MILGTRALDSPDWVGELCDEFPGRIVASVDSVEGKVAVEGWTVVADTLVTELVEHYYTVGVMFDNGTTLFTDKVYFTPITEDLVVKSIDHAPSEVATGAEVDVYTELNSTEHVDLVLVDLGAWTGIEGPAVCPVDAAIIVTDTRHCDDPGLQATADGLRQWGVQAVGIAENFLPEKENAPSS